MTSFSKLIKSLKEITLTYVKDMQIPLKTNFDEQVDAFGNVTRYLS